MVWVIHLRVWIHTLRLQENLSLFLKRHVYIVDTWVGFFRRAYWVVLYGHSILAFQVLKIDPRFWSIQLDASSWTRTLIRESFMVQAYLARGGRDTRYCVVLMQCCVLRGPHVVLQPSTLWILWRGMDSHSVATDIATDNHSTYKSRSGSCHHIAS